MTELWIDLYEMYERFVSIKELQKVNWNQIKRHWKQVSDKIKVTWGKLSEDDLTTIAGNRQQLAGLLQERYGYERVQAEKKVDDFALTLNP